MAIEVIFGVWHKSLIFSKYSVYLLLSYIFNLTYRDFRI